MSTPPPHSSTGRRASGALLRPPLLALCLATSVAVVFSPSLQLGFVSDDWSLIVHNTHAHGSSNLGRAVTTSFWDVSGASAPESSVYRALYRPAVKALQLLAHEAFGAAPAGYHAVNVGLHALVAVLLALWLRRRWTAVQRSTAETASHGHPLAPVIAALFFALSPSRVESVSWISGLPDVLMTVFALAGLLIAAGPPGRGRALGAALLFGLAALSKEAALVLPVLVALDAVLLRAPGEGRRDALRSRRAFVAAATAGVLVALALRVALLGTPELEIGEVTEAPARVLSSFGHYVAATLWPFSPSFHPAIRSYDADFVPVHDPVALVLGTLALVGVAVLAIRARRVPALRPWLADLLYFLLPLAPVVNLWSLGHYSWISERFLYLPHVGLAAVVARALHRVLEGERVRSRAIVVVAAVAALGLFTMTTQARFESDAALWRYEHERDPDNVVALRELGSLAADEGRNDEARALFTEAYERAVQAHDRRMTTDVVLEIARLRTTAVDDSDAEALASLRAFYAAVAEARPAALDVGGTTIAFEPTDDARARVANDVSRVRLPRATVLLRSQEIDEALALLREITTDAPRNVDAWNTLALARARSYDFEGARRASARAMGLSGGDPRSRAIALAIDEAEAQLREDEPEIERALGRARAQLRLGSVAGARAALEEGRLRDPEGDDDRWQRALRELDSALGVDD